MIVKIMTPEKDLPEEQDVKSLVLETENGQIEVLNDHAKIATKLVTGIVSLGFDKDKKKKGVVSRGLFTCENNTANIFAETFEFANEVDKARAGIAIKKLEEKLRTKDIEEKELKHAEIKLILNNMRLKVLEQ